MGPPLEIPYRDSLGSTASGFCGAVPSRRAGVPRHSSRTSLQLLWGNANNHNTSIHHRIFESGKSLCRGNLDKPRLSSLLSSVLGGRRLAKPSNRKFDFFLANNFWHYDNWKVNWLLTRFHWPNLNHGFLFLFARRFRRIDDLDITTIWFQMRSTKQSAYTLSIWCILC